MAAAGTLTFTFVAVGAVNSGTSPTVVIPAGIQSDYLLVLCVSSGGNTTTPSGWTLVAASGSGQTRIATFFKISNGSEINFTLGNSSARTQCGVILYKPSAGDIVSYVSVTTNTGSSTTASTTTQSVPAVPALIVSHFIKQPSNTNIGTVAGTNQRLLGTADNNLTNLRVVDEFPLSTGTSTSRAEAASYLGTFITNAAVFKVTS